MTATCDHCASAAAQITFRKTHTLNGRIIRKDILRAFGHYYCMYGEEVCGSLQVEYALISF